MIYDSVTEQVKANNLDREHAAKMFDYLIYQNGIHNYGKRLKNGNTESRFQIMKRVEPIELFDFS